MRLTVSVKPYSIFQMSSEEVDWNQVYQEPNQEPGSDTFWKPSNLTRNREVRKNENREPTSNQEPNQEFKALLLVSPGTYWLNQELTMLNQEFEISYTPKSYRCN